MREATMYYRFELKIELGNDAMQTGADVARALRKLAEHMEDTDLETPIDRPDSGHVRDTNGNRVGIWCVRRRLGARQPQRRQR
jgi:hypothetical protein